MLLNYLWQRVGFEQATFVLKTIFFFITTGKSAVAILFAIVLHFITNLQLVRSKKEVQPFTVGLIGVLDEQIERFRLGPCRELGSHRRAFVL
jgi:hypothetical protein